MSLEAAARSVGPDVALRQADSVYQLSRQSTSDPDTAKVAKMRLAFSNHPMWIKTSNPKVTKENCKGKEVYRVGFLHQANKGTKNKPFKHSKRHASLHLAEASMFEVRFAKESKSAKAAILKVLSGEAEMEALPKKKLPAQRSGTKGKATTMRYDHAARSSNRPNRNPNGPGDMSAEALADRHGGSSNWMEIIQRSGHRLFLTKGSRDGDAKILREACESGQWWKLMPFGELNNQHIHFHSLVHTLAGLRENQYPRAQFQELLYLI